MFQFIRIASTPCGNAMAWPKLSMMNNRNGRHARMMSLMMTRRRSILRMHDLLSKMPTRWSTQSSEDASPPRANANRSSLLGRSCRSPSTTWSPLDWSEHPVTFSRANQWVDIPYPGHFPLVLDPTIRNVWFKMVLIDGGSALNILFIGALTELGLTKEYLAPVDSPF